MKLRKQESKRVSFPLGRVVATRRVLDSFNSVALGYMLSRHIRCDWGDLCDEDWKRNDDAVQYGERLLSCYTANGEKVYIITEADRSMTTILFADEY